MLVCNYQKLRPKFRLTSDYDEACKRVAEHEANGGGLAAPQEEEEESDESDAEADLADADEEDDAANDVGGESDGSESGSSSDEFDSDGSDDEEEDEDDSVIFTSAKKRNATTEEDDAFEREFEQMMLETIETRKREVVRAPTLDVPYARSLFGAADRRAQPDASGNVVFGVLSRKGGNKQRTIAVPASSPIAQQAQKQGQDLIEEKEKMKRIVMQFDYQQQVEGARSIEM